MTGQVERNYSWKSGYHPKGFSAAMVGAEFEAIEHENGVLTKEAVVERARPEDSPLHGMFEWDDAIAGERYRLSQAGHYIRHIEVEIIGHGSNTAARTTAFVNIAPVPNDINEPKGTYVNIATAMADANSRATVLARAICELKNIRNKYERLTELASVWDAIDKAV